MHWLRPLHVAPQWDTKAFRLLLKTGLPIFGLDYLNTWVSSCDRLVLLHFGGLKIVGFYALAMMAREAMGIIPGALSEYIYPRMSHSYGQHHDPLRIWRMAVKSSLLVVAFMIPAVVAGWFLMPPVVTKLFPKYAEAVTAAQWMLVGSIFSGANLGKSALLSMKDLPMMTWYQMLNSVFFVLGPVLGSLLCKNTLLGVSLGMVISQAAWLPVGNYLVYRATHRPPKNSPA
jgi:O-antigen/teichoic acid export membrane protein